MMLQGLERHWTKQGPRQEGLRKKETRREEEGGHHTISVQKQEQQ
jgi:hypothetical protein